MRYQSCLQVAPSNMGATYLLFLIFIILQKYWNRARNIKQKSQMITLTFCVCPLANNLEKEELSNISVSRTEKTDEFIEHNPVVAAEDG